MQDRLRSRVSPLAKVVSLRAAADEQVAGVRLALHRKIWQAAVNVVLDSGVKTAVVALAVMTMHPFGRSPKASALWATPVGRGIRIIDKSGRRRALTRIDVLVETLAFLRHEQRYLEQNLAEARRRSRRRRKRP